MGTPRAFLQMLAYNLSNFAKSVGVRSASGNAYVADGMTTVCTKWCVRLCVSMQSFTLSPLLFTCAITLSSWNDQVKVGVISTPRYV